MNDKVAKIRKTRSSNRHKYVWRNMLEHVLIVERILGKELPKGVEIHHVDGNGRHNAHTNLVVCPDHAYHALLHARTEALEACGNAAWRRCCYCKTWDAPQNLAFWKRSTGEVHTIAHRQCANAKNRAYKKANPNWVAEYLASRRRRYAQDVEHREKIRARQRLYNARQSGRTT